MEGLRKFVEDTVASRIRIFREWSFVGDSHSWLSACAFRMAQADSQEWLVPTMTGRDFCQQARIIPVKSNEL